MSEFEVHALCYARRDGVRGDHFLGHTPDSAEPHATAYYVWLARSPEHTVLVDAGMRPERAARVPGLDYTDPVRLLACFGVEARGVDHVVLTHLHYDHAGTASAFTRAVHTVQQSEVDYWTGPWAQRITRERWLLDEGELRRLEAAGERLRLVDGDAEVVPGVSVHLVGGHTAGTQVVRIATAAGPVVVASDASHFYENLEADHPAPLLHSTTGVYGGFDRIRELAGPTGIFLPGHDPRVLERYPTDPSGRIARIA
ncbi:N-acyl homoserine lactonase family protein [Amycolatopsis sp. FDAARGOS 1241]|uniref:N-acyl homoserine lactonase family protein n=1 Tax=Amycolatopsis sp. FDAARGOS 1241 TaxID=2778070 RepID=UPI00194F08AD|nr:N-acyl homoserine lactonase family protein [Amycolatopsis sp. FDAARGOS 1241]QRP43476.1 N-acyl homoserine lactonase family protein [Amycolatopsis sp. FDAARGOS 1241]